MKLEVKAVDEYPWTVLPDSWLGITRCQENQSCSSGKQSQGEQSRNTWSLSSSPLSQKSLESGSAKVKGECSLLSEPRGEAFGFLAPLNFSFSFFFLLPVFEGVCHDTHLKVRGHLSRVGSLLPCGSLGSNSGHLSWWQGSSLTEPSCEHPTPIFFFGIKANAH